MKHLLFVCSAALDRSPGAAAFFKKSKKYEAKAAGVHLLSRTYVSKQAVEWADVIFVMDELNDKHKSLLIKKHPEAEKKPIIILDVPNKFMRNSPELFRLLKDRLVAWLIREGDKLEAQRVERVSFDDWEE